MTVLLFIIGCFLSLFFGFKAGVAAVSVAIHESYRADPNKAVLTIDGEYYKLTKTGGNE